MMCFFLRDKDGQELKTGVGVGRGSLHFFVTPSQKIKGRVLPQLLKLKKYLAIMSLTETECVIQHKF